MIALGKAGLIWVALTVLVMSGCAVPIDEPPPLPTASPSATPVLLPATATVVRLPAIMPKDAEPTAAAEPTREITLQIHTPIPAIAAPVAPAAGKDTVERATEDLAQRLGIPLAEVEVLRATTDEYTWGDLLCPAGKGADQPIPAFVVGQEIVLAAGEQEYYYRARGRMLIYCGER